MKILGFNGSARKNGNSMKLLNEAVRGAQDAGAEVEIIQLYEKNFKGCRSCFACKRKTPFYGKGCAMKDDFSAIMAQMLEVDGWIFCFADLYGAYVKQYVGVVRTVSLFALELR